LPEIHVETLVYESMILVILLKIKRYEIIR